MSDLMSTEAISNDPPSASAKLADSGMLALCLPSNV
jgi:hypothetical protein